MDHSILNRNHPNHHYQQQVIKTELVHHTIESIKHLLIQYPSDFDVSFLHQHDKPSLPIHEAIANLYNQTLRLYQSNNIVFDDHWVGEIMKCHSCPKELTNQPTPCLLS